MLRPEKQKVLLDYRLRGASQSLLVISYVDYCDCGMKINHKNVSQWQKLVYNEFLIITTTVSDLTE